MRVVSKVFLVAAIVSLCWVSPVGAAAISLLDYEFPASSDNLVTNTTVTDLGAGAHNATASGFSGTGLSSIVPTGAAVGTSSASFNGGSATIVTTEKKLLNITAVAAAGGFTYDVWFNSDKTTGMQKIIDYAGTDYLRFYQGKLGFFIDQGDGTSGSVTTPGSANTWYHVLATFDCAGNSVVDGKVAGTMTLTVNDTVVGTIAANKSVTSDNKNRSIGIGNHPQGYAEYFSGEIYNPKIYLGVSVPEPSALALLGSGLAGLLCYAWRKRK